ncbi:E3 ubiquitin-protein ligase, partial [Reticulomyxa filosa]
ISPPEQGHLHSDDSEMKDHLSNLHPFERGSTLSANDLSHTFDLNDLRAEYYHYHPNGQANASPPEIRLSPSPEMEHGPHVPNPNNASAMAINAHAATSHKTATPSQGNGNSNIKASGGSKRKLVEHSQTDVLKRSAQGNTAAVDQSFSTMFLGSTKVINSQFLIRLEEEYGENVACAICMDVFAKGDIMARLLCGHFFHKSCLVAWLLKSPTCPNCREHVEKFSKVSFL